MKIDFYKKQIEYYEKEIIKYKNKIEVIEQKKERIANTPKPPPCTHLDQWGYECKDCRDNEREYYNTINNTCYDSFGCDWSSYR